MATRKELLKNLKNYSPEEIAVAVRTGEVSLYELSKETEGAFTPLLKKKVKAILEQPESVTTNSVHEQMPVFPIHEEQAVIVGTTDVFQQTVDNTTTNTVDEKEEIDNKGMFKRPYSFHGRIRRTEYGISLIIYTILHFIWVGVFDALMQSYPSPGDEGMILIIVLMLAFYSPLLWFSLAQGCKRCHDRGSSGWYQLIPLYGLVLLFGDGEKGSNEYGSNPKD